MIKEGPDNKTVFFEIGNLQHSHRTGIKSALHDIGSENKKHTVNLIRTGSKSGRVYKIRGMSHQASAPGEAPANLSGGLAKSVGFKVRGFYQVEFGDKVKYGKFLETGTRKMKPRPHLITTVNDRERDNFNALQRVVKTK